MVFYDILFSTINIKMVIKSQNKHSYLYFYTSWCTYYSARTGSIVLVHLHTDSNLLFLCAYKNDITGLLIIVHKLYIVVCCVWLIPISGYLNSYSKWWRIFSHKKYCYDHQLHALDNSLIAFWLNDLTQYCTNYTRGILKYYIVHNNKTCVL